MQFTLNVNGKAETVDVEPETPLLWVLRDNIGLTGTKYGCGIARCGACTIHVDGQPMKACQLPASAAVGKRITTIEGLSPNSSHPVQQAWVEIGVPQCGYCQSGQIMAAAALARQAQESDPGRDRGCDGRQSLPLRYLSADRPGNPPRLRACAGIGEADMTKQILSRRSFIRASVAAGGGLMLGFHMPVALAASIGPRTQSTTTAVGIEINAWIVIDKDGTVTLRIPHTEMGQGGITSVAMLIAEELNVDWSKIKTEFADANRHLRNNKEYKVMSTHGSQLVRLQHPHLMGAGASARERLKQAAAEAWGVDRSQVEAKLGVLTAGNRTGTYGEFAEAAAKVKLDKEPEIKTDPAKWWLLGKPKQRLDIPQQGQRQRAIRDRYPRSRHGLCRGQGEPGAVGNAEELQFRRHQGPPRRASRRCRSRRFPASAASRTCRMPSRSSRTAGTAPRRRSICFRSNGTSATAPIPARPRYFAEGHRLMEQKGLVSGKEDPMAAEIIAAAKKRVTASYERPFETHARMEPINATVHVQPDRVDVWSPTQDQSAAITPGRRPARRRSQDRLCPHHVPGRRLRRQRRRRHRGHAPGGRDLQADRQAREGHLVARGGPRAGQAAPARRGQAQRGHRR